jgi:TonB family protein
MKLVVLWTAVLGIIATAPAAAEERQPIDRWTVNFDESQCVASRTYGTTENPLHLVIKRPAVGDVVQLGVTRRADRLDTDQFEAKVGFGGGKPLSTTVFAFTASASKQRAFLFNLSPELLPAGSTQTVMSLQAAGRLDEHLIISGMAPLMTVMAQCVADLQKVWNAGDEAGHSPSLRQQPKAYWGPILQAHTYPGVSSARLFGGAVTVALLIDESGKVADCTVVESSGAASLGVQACALIAERGKFSPAIGIDGKPAKGAILERIDWRPSKMRSSP